MLGINITSDSIGQITSSAQGPQTAQFVINDGVGNAQLSIPEGGAVEVSVDDRPVRTITDVPGSEDIGFLYAPAVTGGRIDVNETVTVDLGIVYFQGAGPITIEQDILRGGVVIASDIRTSDGPQTYEYTVLAADVGTGVTLRSRLTNGSNVVVTMTEILSANVLQPIQVGANMWADMSNTAYITLNTNGFNGEVERVADRSGNGNDLTQSTVANGPSLVPAAFNGLPALEFNAARRLRCAPLTVRSFFFVAGNVTPLADQVCPIISSRFDDGSADRQYAWVRGGGGTGAAISVDGSGVFNGDSASVYVDTGASGSGENVSLSGLTPAEREGLRLWYVALDQDYSLIDTIGALRGSQFYHNGGTRFGELIAFPTPLTAAQANAVANEIAPKWGLTWADLP